MNFPSALLLTGGFRTISLNRSKVCIFPGLGRVKILFGFGLAKKHRFGSGFWVPDMPGTQNTSLLWLTQFFGDTKVVRDSSHEDILWHVLTKMLYCP